MPEQAKREPGFYWVRFEWETPEWTIGWYAGERNARGALIPCPWSVIGEDDVFSDEDITEVGDRIDQSLKGNESDGPATDKATG